MEVDIQVGRTPPNQIRAEQKPATLQTVARVPRRQERRKSNQDAGV